jgi:multicomponent Na+:H+ antiporter subunit E
MSSLGFAAVLVAIWVLLWGTLSVANVLSGVLVAAVLIVAVPGTTRRAHLPTVRPLALARLVVHVVAQVVAANITLARQILGRRAPIRTGVVAVSLPECSDGLLALIANLVALTPGTMPVEVNRTPPVMYVHVLYLRDVDEVRREVGHLRNLAVRAFGTPAAIAALPAEEESS